MEIKERKYVFSFSGSNEDISWELVPHNVWWRRWLGQVELIRKTKRVINRYSLEFKTYETTAINSYFQSGLKVMADMVCDKPECFQLMESFPTSYIPTNGVPETMYPDVSSIHKDFGLFVEPQRTNLFINSETPKE